jgi:hypothetical protein
MYRKLLMIAIICAASLVGAGTADAAKQGQMCGGIAGIQCDAGLWCQMPTGQCVIPDGAGTCAKAPEICNQIFLPVCGCNGRTFSNDCERQMSKVSKAHDGRCS